MLLSAFRNKGNDALGNIFCIIMLVQVIILCLTVIPTEIELEKRFDESGNRKQQYKGYALETC